MKKKNLFILLTLSVILALSACGNNDAGKVSNNKQLLCGFNNIEELQLIKYDGNIAKIDLNEEKAYITESDHSVKINTIAGGGKESLLTLFAGKTFNAKEDYSDVMQIGVDIFNPNEGNIVVGIALFFANSVVGAYQQYVVEGGKQERIRSNFDASIMGLMYNIEFARGLKISILNENTENSAQAYYLDNLHVITTDKKVNNDLIKIVDDKLLGFENWYDIYLMKMSADQIRPVSKEINLNKNYVKEGNSSLMLVIPQKLTQDLEYNTISISEKLFSNVDFSKYNGDKMISFDIYNKSKSLFEFSLRIYDSQNRKIVKYYNLKINEWANVALAFKDLSSYQDETEQFLNGEFDYKAISRMELMYMEVNHIEPFVIYMDNLIVK